MKQNGKEVPKSAPARLAVIAPAFFAKLDTCRALIESSKGLGLPLHLYGAGEPWANLYQGKVVRLRQEIERLDAEYFLVSDASDAFLVADEEEILGKFLATGCQVLVSAEKNCWPQPMLASLWPGCEPPYRYVNSGGYIGSKKALLKLLADMTTVTAQLPFQRTRDWDNDQFRMSLVYLENRSIALDHSCQIFQAMHSTEMNWQDNRAVNPIYGTKPAHLHFNGNWPGIKESFERRFRCNAQAITA